MLNENITSITVKNHTILSKYLGREVKVDCYLPLKIDVHDKMSLLLINDGQDLVTMKFEDIISDLYKLNEISPLFCVGMHCSEDRKNEYGTAEILDYKGRGARASLYTKFVIEELLPYIRYTYQVSSFREKSFAGFSLGGLSALDIVWNHPVEFSKVGCSAVHSGGETKHRMILILMKTFTGSCTGRLEKGNITHG